MNYKDVIAKINKKYPEEEVSDEMRKFRFN
jgi:cytochrome c-type biogenesis protein CcmE